MKNFSIFKKDNKGDEKRPTHSISAKIGEDYVEVGACWTKDGKNGKFLSCKLQDAYVDHTKNIARKGFALIQEGQTDVVKEYNEMTEDKSEDKGDSPF